jgi:hypothetical protein
MLKGTLEHFALADVFRLMSWAKKTGKLEVARSAGRGKIFFRDGEVYYAESSLSREPLGQKLIRSGSLTDGQLMKALDQNAQSGERVGQILVANGWVTQEQLQGALRQQIEDAVFDLLRWELGEFDFQPQVEADIEVQISVSVENLIIEASRRLDELEVIQRKIPNEDARLKMANKPPEGAAEINITPEEWRMLVLVDGSRTIHEIALLVGMDDFGALRGLYGLVSAGLVEVVSEHEPQPSSGGEAVGAFVTDGALQPMDQETAVSQEPQTVAHPIEQAQVEPTAAAEPVATDPVVAEPASMDPGVGGSAPANPVAEPEMHAPVVTEAAASEPVISSEPVFADPVTTPEPYAAPAADSSVFEPATESTWDAETLSSVFKVEEPQVPDAQNGFEVEAPHGIVTPEPVASEPVAFEGVSEQPASAPEIPTEAQTEITQLVDESTQVATFEAAPAPESFDAPAPGELETHKPDPFLNDLLEQPPASSPAPPAPSPAAPQVDRSTVVRELAGLFSDDERQPRAEGTAEGDQRKRVEDDDALSRGLISRLIDGVKGL